VTLLSRKGKVALVLKEGVLQIRKKYLPAAHRKVLDLVKKTDEKKPQSAEAGRDRFYGKRWGEGDVWGCSGENPTSEIGGMREIKGVLDESPEIEEKDA